MDSVTLAFALEGVRRTGIGKRQLASSGPNTMPDLLSISLSTTDAIGHAFGPDSREIHDQVLRVDRWLGQFMRALEQEVPSARIIYALTGDHGVAPLPELEVPKTGHGGRIWLSDISSTVEQELEARYATDFSIDFDNGLMFGDVGALRARGINADSLASAIVAEATKRAGVRAGFTAATLATSSDSAAVRWRRSLPPSLGYLAVFATKPGFIWSPGKSTAEHGTPSALTLSVPISLHRREHSGWPAREAGANGGHRADARRIDRCEAHGAPRRFGDSRGDRPPRARRGPEVARETMRRARRDCDDCVTLRHTDVDFGE